MSEEENPDQDMAQLQVAFADMPENSRTLRVTNPDQSPISRSNSVNHHAEPEPEHSNGSDESYEDADSGGEWVEEPDSDNERPFFKSFFDEKCFGSLVEMVSYDHTKYGFDLPNILKDQNMYDTVQVIKMINLVRSCNAQDLKHPVAHVLSSLHLLSGDEYLIPVMHDDAVLIHADELLNLALNQNEEDEFSLLNMGPKAAEYDKLRSYSHPKLVQVVTEMMAARDDAVLALRDTKAEYDQLAAQFQGQRELMRQVLDKKWDVNESSDLNNPVNGLITTKVAHSGKIRDHDAHYYESYAHHNIHEIMLSDTVRTDAYRDFVYENKHLFAGKVVLDVGCGTGILSMFCANVGAEHVYAVDNSAIIDKAKEIVKNNGFARTITCIHGKVEHIYLPEKVDIIISEWMGYGLLYEAMLDSVLVAKDRFLAKGGLVVPSHTKLFVAPFSDPEVIGMYRSSWKNVYGFDMGVMLQNAFDDARVEDLPSSAKLLSSGFSFHDINVGTATRPTSSFQGEPLHITVTEDAQLTGFCIWFDVIFTTNPAESPLRDLEKDKYDLDTGKQAHSFSTGPKTAITHWQQVQLIIDYGENPVQTVQGGDVIHGQIEYKIAEDNDREVDIEMEWRLGKEGATFVQKWHLC